MQIHWEYRVVLYERNGRWRYEVACVCWSDGEIVKAVPFYTTASSAETLRDLFDEMASASKEAFGKPCLEIKVQLLRA